MKGFAFDFINSPHFVIVGAPLSYLRIPEDPLLCGCDLFIVSLLFGRAIDLIAIRSGYLFPAGSYHTGSGFILHGRSLYFGSQSFCLGELCPSRVGSVFLPCPHFVIILAAGLFLFIGPAEFAAAVDCLYLFISFIFLCGTVDGVSVRVLYLLPGNFDTGSGLVFQRNNRSFGFESFQDN